MPRKSSAIVAPGKGRKYCCFCGLDDDNELDYGKIHEYSGIVTHYYCLLFSSNMQQQGLDEEGILGFLPGDIHKELKRGKRLVCSYCKKSGATLGCCNTRCKKIFHYPCGLKAGSLHQFFGEFRSYCIHHRPKQIIEERILKELSQCEKKICYICYDEVNAKDDLGTIWAPCCKKNAWFHRTCVQQLAISAGYFFKCPLCNNKTEFQRAMLDHGIFIPSQDASWELVPNAFQELLYRHNRCDAGKCVCPKGREYTSTNAKWELTLCRTCGSQGIHMACGNLKWGEPVWECNECTSILNKSMSSSSVSSRHRGSRVEKNSSDEESSSESEISVGNYTDGEFAESLNPTGELQSSLFFPKTPIVGEESPEKQRRDDTDKTGSSKSPRKVIEGPKPRDNEESNEELAPLTKKPKISLTSKDDSDDDDVIVVSGPSRKEPCRALENSWVLHHYGKTAQTGEVKKKPQDEPAKSSNLLQELSIVAKKVSATSTGSLTNPQVPFPMSKIEKPVPIEIDLSDSENSPITTSSTSVIPKILTNAKPSVPELNIQIINVMSLAPETFATGSESHDQLMDRKEKTGNDSVTGEPQNPSTQPVYERLEIVRLDVQSSTDNSSKPGIYGLTIPGTHNAVPLVFTRVDEPQSSPSNNQNNPPIPPSLSKLAGPKSRKAAILAAAASNNLANRPNAASNVEVPESAASTLPNEKISAILSSKSTPPTTPTLQNNKQPAARKLAATPDSYSKTGQTWEKGISTVMPDRRANGNSPIANLVPKMTTSTIPSSEYSAVSSPMSMARQNQTNQRQTVSASHATMPTIQNSQRSNIVTMTIDCDDKPSDIASKSTGSTIRSKGRWPLLAPKPRIQSNDIADRSKSSASKLSYSLPLEAVVNDQILQSCASKKLEKTPSKQNTPGGTRPVQKIDDPTNRINLTTTHESPPVTSKYFAQNVPANGFISSRRIGILTSKSPSRSSPNVASISSNSFAAQKVSHPAFPVGNTCELQNPCSPGISAKDTNPPLLNGVQRNLEPLQNSFNGVDLIPAGSRTVSQPRKIPIAPHSTDSHAENKKSLDPPENCDGDAGTSLDVPPKRAVPADLKSNVRSHQNIDGTKDANDVSEKRRTEDLFRHDSQHDEEKNETTECSTTRERGHPADRVGLINRTINLRDLKFELCGSSIVKMTLYETYCVNMKIEVGKKRKSASCKNYEVPKKNCSDLSAERTDIRSLPRGCDILRNTDGLHGFSGSFTSSCSSGNNGNSGENGAASQSSDNLQSKALTKAPEIVSSNLTCGDGNSRGQDELKENLDPVPSPANVGAAGPIERKNKTRLRNGGVNTMQLLNEQDVQEKIIDEVTRNSPRKMGNQVNSLGTVKTASNERKEVACGVARNLFAASDEEANNSRCENMAKMCKMRGVRANEDEKMSERKSESPPKRPKYGKFEEPNDDETSSVNNSGFDNLPFGHLVFAEKVRNRKIPRIENVCKIDKLHTNNGLKNGLKPSRERETKSDNSVCCKVSIDLAKIQTVIANKIHFFEKTESSEFQKSEKKNKRQKLEARSLVRKFRSLDDLIIDQLYSSIQIFPTIQARKWKSDDDLSRCSKLEDAFARSNRVFHAENPRRSHEQNTLSFEKHDCVR